MRLHYKNHSKRSVLDYRQAQGIEPDPVRRVVSFLISFGIIASALVLADAIRYQYEAPLKVRPPMVVDLVEALGNLEHKDRGDQLVKKEEDEQPKTEPEKKEEEKPADDPPAPVKNEEPKPPGPADASEDSTQPAKIAIGMGGPSPRSLFSNRGGPAKEEALGKYGGDARTENAVKLGLQWLARHQDADGRWSRAYFNRNCLEGYAKCSSGLTPDTLNTELDQALTGLSVLAFAAANNSHQHGPYKENVARAVKYLRSIQDEKTGRFGSADRQLNYYMMYNHGIVTFALAELCAMTRDPAIIPCIEKAVEFIVNTQQFSGAWDYTDAKTGRYDTSVTGWQVLALKSAQAAGVEIPPFTLYMAARFLDSVTLGTGEVIYSNKFPAPGRRGQGMVAVGLASSIFLGFPSDGDVARRQSAILLRHLPDWQSVV